MGGRWDPPTGKQYSSRVEILLGFCILCFSLHIGNNDEECWWWVPDRVAAAVMLRDGWCQFKGMSETASRYYGGWASIRRMSNAKAEGKNEKAQFIWRGNESGATLETENNWISHREWAGSTLALEPPLNRYIIHPLDTALGGCSLDRYYTVALCSIKLTEILSVLVSCFHQMKKCGVVKIKQEDVTVAFYDFWINFLTRTSS